MGYTEYLEKAPTLKDLRERIDEAITMAGEDAPWNGWDDGELHIWNDNKKIVIRIEP